MNLVNKIANGPFHYPLRCNNLWTSAKKLRWNVDKQMDARVYKMKSMSKLLVI